LYYNHGYEGFIEFQIDPKLRDELIVRTTEIIDRKNGNEFYFEDNKLKLLYPKDIFVESNDGTGFKKWKTKVAQTSHALSGKPELRERIYDLLLWLKENGSIVNAEITPYDLDTGEKFDHFLTINNRFYRCVSIEKADAEIPPVEKKTSRIKLFR